MNNSILSTYQHSLTINLEFISNSWFKLFDGFNLYQKQLHDNDDQYIRETLHDFISNIIVSEFNIDIPPVVTTSSYMIHINMQSLGDDPKKIIDFVTDHLYNFINHSL